MTPQTRTPGAPNATDAASRLPVVAQFLAVGGLFLVGVAAVSAVLTGGVTTLGTLVALGLYAAFLGFGAMGLRGFPHGTLGLCNVVTLFRLILVAGLVAALLTPGAGAMALFGVAAIALSLDGLDGWLARRSGHQSDFGARFDMEVDAVLALVLAGLAYFGGHAGAFVLMLGLPRYVFWLAQVPMPWLNGDLPERFSRKLTCVVQIGVLIAVLLPIFSRFTADLLVAAAALMLVWSFAWDIRHLWRTRA